MSEQEHADTDIAIIGMSGKFPGSDSIEEFWQNLLAGKSGIRDITDEQLKSAGVPSSLSSQANYVKRAATISDVKCFDAEFFGYSEKEAKLIDPQHRLFLEYSWKALEAAGYIPDEIDVPVGVYAGCGLNRYMLTNLSIDTMEFDIDEFQKMIASEKDFLATRASYKLNLKGPSINVQSACSTSLLATQLAVLSLQTYQCDMAVCGGVSVGVPHGAGYLYSDGLIFSADGYCRPFSKDANGTLFGEGVGVVVLKRLANALEDDDDIIAVISGAAVNNDGRDKVGFTAPSVNGQAEVIALSHELSGILPEQIKFIETHGTATALGDPIELAALKQAFGNLTVETPFCALGTLKANIGHLDAAAGIAALIKTALIARHKTIPPVYVNGSPPQVGEENSPFYFNDEVVDLSKATSPIYAGVSSFGIGGTNVHLMLHNASVRAPETSTVTAAKYSLPVSALHRESINQQQIAITELLRQDPSTLADFSFTLNNARKRFSLISASVGYPDTDNKITINSGEKFNLQAQAGCAFMFTGQGSQYLGMTSNLYQGLPLFAKNFDPLLEILVEEGLLDVKRYLVEPESLPPSYANHTDLVQPALFVIQYAIAKTIESLGLQATALMGHSIGEYVAACLDGVFDTRTAIRVVAERGRLMATTAEGAMLVIFTTRERLEKLLTSTLEISIENSTNNIVVSGSGSDISSFCKQLDVECLKYTLLPNKHAFHSRHMDPILAEFRHFLGSIELARPDGRLILASNQFKTESAATVEYWVQHLRCEVNYKCAIDKAAAKNVGNFIEVGPGGALSRFVKETLGPKQANCIRSLLGPNSDLSEAENFDLTLASLAMLMPALNLAAAGFGDNGRRATIPTYQFLKKEHWLTASTIKRQVVEQQLAPPDGQQHDPNFDAGARNDLDRSLLAVWERVLERRQITIDDNFFELGGDSLAAIKLVKDMHKASGIEFLHSSVFEHPTIRGLIEQAGSDVDKAASVVLLNNVKSGMPIFCLCGVQIYKQFADHFSSNPVYGMYAKEEIAIIQKEELGATSGTTSIDSLVDTYVDAVIRYLPGKELSLVGLSFGGLLSLEVCEKLLKRGYTVNHVVLFDSYIHSSHFRSAKKIVIDSYFRFKEYGFIKFSKFVKDRVFKLLHKKLKGKSPARTWDHERAEKNRGEAFHRIASSFNTQPKTYNLDALLIKASRTNAGFGLVSKPDYGMSEVVLGKLTVAEVHADHVDMVQGEVVDEVYELVNQYMSTTSSE